MSRSHEKTSVKISSLAMLSPIRLWLGTLNKATIHQDAAAGLTNAAIVLPQGVAFAIIAGLPPECGHGHSCDRSLVGVVGHHGVRAHDGDLCHLVCNPFEFGGAGVGLLYRTGADRYDHGRHTATGRRAGPDRRIDHVHLSFGNCRVHCRGRIADRGLPTRRCIGIIHRKGRWSDRAHLASVRRARRCGTDRVAHRLADDGILFSCTIVTTRPLVV